MLIDKTYQSPSDCTRLFKALERLDLFQSGGDILQMIYRDPSAFFQDEVKLILHYDNLQRVDGVLIAAKGYFLAQEIARRHAHDHYGLIQIFVREDARRRGIGRNMIGKLIDSSPKAKFMISKRVIDVAPKAMRERLTGIYPSVIGVALTGRERRFFKMQEHTLQTPGESPEIVAA